MNIKNLINSMFADKKCKHEYNKNTHLWDFHRGNDALYIRIAEVCEKCGHERVTSTPLPDEIDALLDASKLEIFRMGSNRTRKTKGIH